jgi:RHS repeat-associated protein
MRYGKHSPTAKRALMAVITLLWLWRPGVSLGQIWCGNPFTPSPPPPPPLTCPPESPAKSSPFSSSLSGGGGDSCPTCSGSPVYCRTGIYFTSATDLQVPAVGPPLGVSRTYGSNQISQGLMGPGWTSNLTIRLSYSVYLFAAPSTYERQADIRMPDSRLFTFTENSDGTTYAPPAGRRDALVKQPDGSWRLTIQNSRTVWRFNAQGALTSITDEYGNVQNWTYDANGRLERVTDVGSGRYLDVYYGADGRISAVQDSGGRLVQYAYNADGSLATVTDPLERDTTYDYDEGRFGPRLTAIADHWGRTVATMTYTSATDDRIQSYNEDGETYTYDYTHVVTEGHTHKSDSQGHQWVLGYTGEGYVTDRTSPGGAVLHKDFSSDGTLLGVTDEAGVRTAYTYDGQGRVETVDRDALHGGPRYEYGYDPSFPDKVVSVTVKNPATNQVDPTWQSWRYDYYSNEVEDGAPGALYHVYRVRTDGITLDTVATYEVDARGRVTRQTTATGAATDYAFDTAGNLVTVTGPANNDAGLRPVTTYGHDALGRVTSVSDPLGRTTTTTYDALGRPLTVTLPDPVSGSPLTFTTTYTYDNWDAVNGLTFTHMTDPNGNLTKQGYDALGRLVRSVDALGHTTAYAYTGDLLTSITDANNNVTSYVYDVDKRLQQTTFPDGATETYEYYPDGQLHTRTDRKGLVITYAYDALKRLTSKTYPGGAQVTYTYQGQPLAGVLDETVAPNETHAFTYDAAYRVSNVVEGPRGSIGYTYTADDRVGTMTIAGGPTTTYGYYPDGSARSLAWSPVSGQFTYTYNRAGQVAAVTFPNGQTRSFTYDDQGRLVQLANVHPGAGTLAAYTYGYDIDPFTGHPTLLGQRTAVGITAPSLGLDEAPPLYGYDALYQLTAASYEKSGLFGGGTDTWTYDAIGNRLTSTVDGEPRTYTYFKNGTNPLNGQRLASDGELAYTYDANGNTLTRSGVTFGWDADDRMTSIAGAVTASYAYDYQGRRTTKTVSGASTSYLYDGLNLVRTSGASAADYLFGPGIDEPLAMLRGGNVYYVAVDGLGSVTLLSDSAGTVETTYLYDAWGELREQTGTLATDFGYTAREFAEAGLWFYRARYYQPGIGRFVSEDAHGFEAGINFFAYALSNPINAVDPLGYSASTLPKWPPPIDPRPWGTFPWPYNNPCKSGGINDPDYVLFWDETYANPGVLPRPLDQWKGKFSEKCTNLGKELGVDTYSLFGPVIEHSEGEWFGPPVVPETIGYCCRRCRR